MKQKHYILFISTKKPSLKSPKVLELLSFVVTPRKAFSAVRKCAVLSRFSTACCRRFHSGTVHIFGRFTTYKRINYKEYNRLNLHFLLCRSSLGSCNISLIAVPSKIKTAYSYLLISLVRNIFANLLPRKLFPSHFSLLS